MAPARTPGNAVAVYLHGKSVFSYASGYADWENKIPLVGAELFNIYSCSKLATVTAGMQLLEQGKILLTDPLYEYMPEFRHMSVRQPDGTLEAARNPILIGDLFSMTAGFNYDLNAPGFQKTRELTAGHMDTVTAIRCLAGDPLSFEPGTHWQYSLCHDVLAALISVVTGQAFRTYVKEHIFAPLDMHESFYHQTPETLHRTAQQYRFVSDSEQCISTVEAQKARGSSQGYFENIGKDVEFILGDEYDSGGAGITTSVEDYAKLLSALAGMGVGSNGQRILSGYSVDLMRRNRLNATQLRDYDWPQLEGCGYGLGVRTHLDQAVSGLLCGPGEFGWGGAAGSTAIVDPEAGLAVFYVQHLLNPRAPYYQPRLRNVVYSCL